MSASNTYSSNGQPYDATAIPPRWLECPRKSDLIADKFVAFKTPLDGRYNDRVSGGERWTCTMMRNIVKFDPKKLGLVIDLTNTNRFYDAQTEFEGKNIQYEKIRCRGHGETPNDEQIKQFVDVCNNFVQHHPDDIIGVHCTHGFNRTGFMICIYLSRTHDMSIDAAIDIFAKARPPGIYKQDYLDELWTRFGDESVPGIPAPSRPDWCQTNSDDEDEPNERPVANGGTKRPRENVQEETTKYFKGDSQKPIPQFAVSLPGVTTVSVHKTMTDAQLKCQRMCEWNGRGFPGSQPISMDITNYTTIVQSPYMVSWKADGTRYMMLIEAENKIYMFDRDHNVFQISNLRFPRDEDNTRHLTNTLVDGELVIDNVNGNKVPRFLIYDIVVYEDEHVGKKPFRERLDIIRRSIIDVRNKAITKGLLDRSREPFSIRNKDFWDLSTVHKLVGPKFQSQIAHEVDGLIFQPEADPYIPGRSPRVLKWKEDNTIDFRLKILTTPAQPGLLPQKKACLFVNGLATPFTQMRLTPNLRQYDNKIIECSFRNNEWHFHRERTDKSFPNAKATAFGAIEALRNPITKEILCKLIDDYLKLNLHRGSTH